MLSIFVKGAVLGLGLVIPLGPQNAFLFQRATVQQRFIYLLPVLFVAILCDAFLILSAVIGVNLIDPFIKWKSGLMLVGALFLLYMAWTMWKSSNTAEWSSQSRVLNIWQQILYTLSISLLNPHAILDTFFVIGTVSSNYIGVEKHAFAFGCIFIDIIWFLSLTFMGFYLKKIRNGVKIIKITNRISAVIMCVISLDIFYKLLFN